MSAVPEPGAVEVPDSSPVSGGPAAPGEALDVYAGSGWLVLGLLLFMAGSILLAMR